MLWACYEILVVSGLSVSIILTFENMIIVNILLLYIFSVMLLEVHSSDIAIRHYILI